MAQIRETIKNTLKPHFPKIRQSRTHHPGRVEVWLVIIALWAINWGTSTVTAVLAIFRPEQSPAPIDDWRTAIIQSSGNLFEGFCVVVLTAVLIKYYAGVSYADAGLAKSPARERYAHEWTVLAYLAVLFGTQWLSNALGSAIPALGSPWYVGAQQENETPQAVVESITRGISAGSEEILFTAGIIILLYAAGYKPWVAWTAAIILRTSFHVYYFPEMIWVPLWAAGTIYIYQRFGSVWPMLVVHILYDVMIDLNKMMPDLGASLITLVVVVYAVFVAIKLLREPKKTPK